MMKRKYITPVSRVVVYSPLHFYAVSGNPKEPKTQWNMNGEEMGEDEPDPNGSRGMNDGIWE